MPIRRVGKSRKAHRCEKCQSKILPGEGYLSWKFRFGEPQVRCLRWACYPKRSELTSNERTKRILETRDNLEEIAHDLRLSKTETATQIAQQAAFEAACSLREVAEEYNTAAEAIENHFQRSPIAKKCRGRARKLAKAAEDLESASFQEATAEEIAFHLEELASRAEVS